jgi:hypothetical protein
MSETREARARWLLLIVNGSRRYACGLLLPAILAAFIATTPRAARAQASQDDALVACVSPIMTCGCTITKRGLFHIGANLTASTGQLTAKGGCIDIRASKVVLSAGIEGGGSFDITGPGGASPTGIGVHILPSSSNDVLELPGSVDGWDIGIEIDGNKNVAQDFDADDNGAAGVEIFKGRNNTVVSFDADDNLNFGVWIVGGFSNQARGGDVSNNGNVGIFVGCSPTGLGGANCSPTSRFNKISDLSVNDNHDTGVAIDTGNTNNVINGLGAHGNGSNDLFDGNTDCDHDLWFFNFFNSVNQACIE